MIPPDDQSAAKAVFGPRLEAAARYAELLSGDGVLRGVVGPKEAAVVWPRHLLNCAVVEELIPAGSRVVDVGSGAGLPGVAIALARPDLVVELVEPLQRRVAFLVDVLAALELGAQVRVHTGRADDPAIVGLVGGADVVTARAVAPLGRLVRWSLPLVRLGGVLLAIKGARAADELKDAKSALQSTGGVAHGVTTCGAGRLETPTRVVVIERHDSIRGHKPHARG